MAQRATLQVDVVFDPEGWSLRQLREDAGPSVIVLIEPLYGGPALIAALDADWDSVVVVADDPDIAPISLISYDQGPPSGALSCRVNAGDLYECALLIDGADVAAGAPMYVAARTNLRPVAARVVRELVDVEAPRLTIVCVASDGDVAADAMFCAGSLCRILLEEWEGSARLTDAAGVTTIIVATDHDPMFGLATGARFARHIARGGQAHDATTAAQRDMHASIPYLVVTRDPDTGDSLRARRLPPRAAAS